MNVFKNTFQAVTGVFAGASAAIVAIVLVALAISCSCLACMISQGILTEVGRDTMATTVATGMPKPTATPESWDCPDSLEGAEYVASRLSDKFHRLGCGSVDNILPENRICFSSREAALSSGLEPCERCAP